MEQPTEVEFDLNFERMLDAYRHADGSITYIVSDPEPSDTSSPRDDDGNIATLIQTNRDYLALDEDEAGLREAHDRWYWLDVGKPYFGISCMGMAGRCPCRNCRDEFSDAERAVQRRYNREQMVRRYIAMFHPDVLYYTDSWDAATSQSGGSRGWGYVTREAWERAMGTDYDGDLTPEKAFDQEVKVFGQWAGGEVYGACHVTVGDPIVIFWDHGAYIDGYTTNEDWCWGFLGYDDNKDISRQFTDSPVLEVLA